MLMMSIYAVFIHQDLQSAVKARCKLYLNTFQVQSVNIRILLKVHSHQRPHPHQRHLGARQQPVLRLHLPVRDVCQRVVSHVRCLVLRLYLHDPRCHSGEIHRCVQTSSVQVRSNHCCRGKKYFAFKVLFKKNKHLPLIRGVIQGYKSF